MCVAQEGGFKTSKERGGASLATAWDWSGHRFAPLRTSANKGVILERMVSPHTFIFLCFVHNSVYFSPLRVKDKLLEGAVNVLLFSELLAWLKSILSYILTYMVVAQYYSLLYL
jgi:hypothetical protein